MQHIKEFLSELERLDVKLRADGEHLRCSAPKGALTPEIRDGIAWHKEAILAALRKEEPAAHSLPEPIRPAPRDGRIPLSFAQQRLWFLNRLEPGSPAYNMPAAFRLEGLLDVPALERSFTEIVRRHETLRTVFPEIEGSAVQEILPPFNVALPVISLQETSGKELEAKLNCLVVADALQPFDLSKVPLLRATVLRIGQASHVLLVTMHHIITDGWSIVVFIRELSALYDAFSRRKAVSLPELPIQYADYACWQQRSLQGSSLNIHLDYWKRRLAGIPPLLELPLDYPRPALQGYKGGTVPFELDAEHVERVKSLCRSEGATLYMALLAAFAGLVLVLGVGAQPVDALGIAAGAVFGVHPPGEVVEVVGGDRSAALKPTVTLGLGEPRVARLPERIDGLRADALQPAGNARFQRGLLSWLRAPQDRSGIGEMLGAVKRISGLFLLDSLGGGFLLTSLLAWFFHERFGVGAGELGLLFAGARVLNALSHLGAAWLARRIGLLNTMVFTHIPSSLLLLAVPWMPSFPVAAAVFLLREGLVEMDVPTRQSYVMAIVAPHERTWAAGMTGLVRLAGWATAPLVAGFGMQRVDLALPLVAGALLKLAYDLLLWRAFRHLRPPEERAVG